MDILPILYQPILSMLSLCSRQ